MLQKLFMIFVLTTIYTAANCQDTLKTRNQFLDLAVSVNINATKFDNSEFINSLKQQNLPVAIDKESIGFSSNIYLSKLRPEAKIIPVIGLAIASEKKNDQNISVNATAVSNDYTIHYVLWNHKEQYFYSGIGFGWMQYKYSFVNHASAPTSYPESLENFTGERNIQSDDLTYLNIAANYDFSIDKSDNLFLGLRISYHLGLNNKNLQLSDGTALEQSPKLKANLLSVGVALTVQ
ncbi:MAG: hypothetical protein ABIR50_00970 [Ginsengibacter sp.]